MEGKRAEALRLLGVLPGSDRRTIGAAYRRLARENHPDVSKRSDAAERFAAISAAYQVLSAGDPVTADAGSGHVTAAENQGPIRAWRGSERESPRLLRRSPRLAARIPLPPWSLEQSPIVPGPVRITPVAGDRRRGLGGAPWWI